MECTGALWLEVAAEMQRARGWEPVYWSGARGMESGVRSRFPGVVFHENTSAAKGRAPEGFPRAALPVLDEALLSRLAYAEKIAVHMMDRMDPDGSFSHAERVQLFQRHLQFALAWLDGLRPDIVVFSAAPHLVYDYVMYEACKLRSVPMSVFVETAVAGLLLAAPSYEQAPDELGDACRKLREQGGAPRLSAAADAYVQRLQGTYEQAVPSYIVEIHSYQPEGRAPVESESRLTARMLALASRLRGRSRSDITAESALPADAAVAAPEVRRRGLAASFGERLRDLRDVGPTLAGAREIKAMLAESGREGTEALRDAIDCTLHLYHAIETEYPLHLRTTAPTPETYLKQFACTPEDSDLSTIEYWLYRSMALRKKRALAAEYRRHTEKVDLTAPFVYVPLQYQPEVSTSPLAGVYVDQHLIVEMLSRLLPEGWFVYVKEHPFQHDRKGSGEQTRSLDFYRRVGALGNVRLVAMDTNPFILIDRARALATATGTSGWEALLRGTPVLAFGHAWYLRCEGAFDARNAEGCREALRRIGDGYRPDPVEVRRFLCAMEQRCFRGYTIPDLATDSGVAEEQNLRGFVEALCSRHGEPARASIS